MTTSVLTVKDVPNRFATGRKAGKLKCAVRREDQLQTCGDYTPLLVFVAFEFLLPRLNLYFQAILLWWDRA
jgi:hypothetical protein